MAKASLTKKNCLKDITQSHGTIFLIALANFLIAFSIVFPLSGNIRGRRMVQSLLGEVPLLEERFLIAIVLGLLLAGFSLYRSYRLHRMIRQDKVFIVEEKLVGKESKEERSRNGKDWFITELVYPLYGSFKTRADGGFYEWSERHTGARGLYFDAEIGDAYYLVVTKDKKEELLMIYNAKRFALAEEDFEKRGERYYFK